MTAAEDKATFVSVHAAIDAGHPPYTAMLIVARRLGLSREDVRDAYARHAQRIGPAA